MPPTASVPPSPPPPPPACASPLDTDESEWRYLSEGKLNIVFTHRHAEGAEHVVQQRQQQLSGPAPTQLMGHVLKINKNVLRAALIGACTQEQLVQRLHFARRYIDVLMRPLLSHAHDSSSHRTVVAACDVDEWLDAGRIVWLRPAVIESLLDRDRGCRPSARVQAFSAFASSQSHSPLIPVFLFEDYTSPLHLHLRRVALSPLLLRAPSSCPPTVCLELKPKWGFLSTPAPIPIVPVATQHILAEHALKSSTCRFCMYQPLKLHKKEVTSLSGFCPLDLYSCCAARVTRALEQLLHTPQNNLRLFVRHGASTREEADQADDDGGWVQMVDLRDADQLAQVVALLLPRAYAATVADAPAPASVPSLQPASGSIATSSAAQQLLLSFLSSFLTRTPAIRALFAHLQLLQQQLDHADIEGAFVAYETICARAPRFLEEGILWRGVRVGEEGATDSASPAWLHTLLACLGRPSDGAPASAAAGPVQTARSASVFVYPPSAGDNATILASPSNSTPLCARWAGAAAADGGANTTPLSCCAPASAASPRLPLAPCTSVDACETRSEGSDGCVCAALQSLRSFLLSTTLKDVSIMCTMQSDEADEADALIDRSALAMVPGAAVAVSSPSSAAGPSLSPLPSLQSRVHYSVRLIDLECKSVDKMREYRRLDQQIVQFYQQHMQMHAQTPVPTQTQTHAGQQRLDLQSASGS